MKLLVRLALTVVISWFAAIAAETPIYVGTYTKPGGSKGIYRCMLDTETGALGAPVLVAEAANPSFLASDSAGEFLYAANESAPGEVSAYAIAADGSLKFLNKQSAKGAGTCHVTVDPTGKCVLAANYGSGSVVVLPIRADGSLGEATGFHQHAGSSADPARQTAPHAHSIYVDPTAKFAYACDLGTDRIYGYKFDAAKGTITPEESASGKVAPGSGSRHMALHPTQNFGYVLSEMLGTITAFRRDSESGALAEFETVSTVPDGFTGSNSTAEIFVHPNGRYLYASNRGHDSIAVFAISSEGKLALVADTPAGVKVPRSFALDPAGRWLVTAGQKSNEIVVFKIDPASGRLTPAGQRVEIGSPVCILFVPR